MAMRSFIAFLKDPGVINLDHGNATATRGKTRAASALTALKGKVLRKTKHVRCIARISLFGLTNETS
jgi:hypothetical protein